MTGKAGAINLVHFAYKNEVGKKYIRKLALKKLNSFFQGRRKNPKRKKINIGNPSAYGKMCLNWKSTGIVSSKDLV